MAPGDPPTTIPAMDFRHGALPSCTELPPQVSPSVSRSEALSSSSLLRLAVRLGRRVRGVQPAAPRQAGREVEELRPGGARRDGPRHRDD